MKRDLCATFARSRNSKANVTYVISKQKKIYRKEMKNYASKRFVKIYAYTHTHTHTHK